MEINDLNEYTQMTTEDGSMTLFSKKYQETMHSKYGAKNETQAIYINGCEILHKYLKTICIFEYSLSPAEAVIALG